MVVPIRKQMDDLDKKIEDMQDSISLIARHVKSEIDEAKKPQKAPAADVQELKQYKDKIGALEAAVRTITKHVKDELEATKKEVKEAQLKTALDIKKSQPQQDEGKITEVERRLNEEIERVEEFVADSNKVLAEDTEKKFSQELAGLEDLIHDSSHVLTEKGMEDYIAKINKVKQSLERYVNVKAQVLETRINEISEMVKGMEASRDFLQMDEKITGLETRMAAEIGDVKRNIEGIDGMKREMEHVKGYIDQQKAGQDATMAETRAKMEENMKKVSLDFTYRINQMKKTIEQETEKFKSLIGEQEIESMKSEIEEIRKAADNENAHRLSLEKNFDDLENAIKNFNVREEVESVKRSIENETANRLSLEKSLADMEKNLTEMKEKYSGITGLEHMDFEKVEQEIAAFRDSVKSAEREMNLKAMNIIT